MWVEFEGEDFEITAQNGTFVRYAQLDILNGLFVDREKDYVYVSADSSAYPEIFEPLREEGVQTMLVEGGFDVTEPPHCWVIASVGRMVVQTAIAITEAEDHE